MMIPADPVARLPARLNPRVAGLMIPLFSIRTAHNMGAGEILDLIPFMDWMAGQGLSVLQILPIYETAPEETSPYQALSSFAIDPVYLSVLNTDSFQETPAIAACLASEALQRDLKTWRERETVDLKSVRALKYRLLRLAFAQFKAEQWQHGTPQAVAFQKFMHEKSVWLDDYALFWEIKKKQGWAPWHDWPLSLRNRDSEALRFFETAHADAILFIKYVQWVLWSQWARVQAHAKISQVKIMGDMPFLLSQDSAEIWRDPHLFHLDRSIGAPPDDFSATGQDWGLPLFNWQEMEKQHFDWWRLRIREAAACYDMIRLDHVVGFFRVWVMSEDGHPYFEPETHDAQIARGKALLSAMIEEAGQCMLVAEDLGCIPDFVRDILNTFQIPGHKILRWEKYGEVYIHPRDYAPLSLSTTGTHDTSTLLAWWREMSFEHRKNFLGLLEAVDSHPVEKDFSEALQHRVIDLLLNGPSRLVIFPIQDILLEDKRINVPATVGPENWCYRMPEEFSTLDQKSPFCERLRYLAEALKRSGRDPRAE